MVQSKIEGIEPSSTTIQPVVQKKVVKEDIARKANVYDPGAPCAKRHWDKQNNNTPPNSKPSRVLPFLAC